jgi:PPOX class probable F420-dependent enzyme
LKRGELVEFVRRRGLAVVATRGPDGPPQAALVGVAATNHGELVFDTVSRSRKCANLRAFPRAALVIGWENEVTLQCEGEADVLTGNERDRRLDAYLEQYPDGRERAGDPSIVLVRVRPDWAQLSDYRPESFGTDEFKLGDSCENPSDLHPSARSNALCRPRAAAT